MIQSKSLLRSIALVGTGLSLIFLGVKPIPAQTNEPAYQRNERDSSGGDLDPFDLINRYRVSPSRDLEQFSEDNQGQIQDAAAEFKRQREQLLNSKSESETEKDPE